MILMMIVDVAAVEVLVATAVAAVEVVSLAVETWTMTGPTPSN